MRRERLRDLAGRFDVPVRVVRDHSTEQGDLRGLSSVAQELLCRATGFLRQAVRLTFGLCFAFRLSLAGRLAFLSIGTRVIRSVLCRSCRYENVPTLQHDPSELLQLSFRQEQEVLRPLGTVLVLGL